MRFSRSKKFVSMLIIFVIVFTYTGQTLKAIASTDGITSITDGFFANSNIKLSSYFEDAENQSDEKVSDVNEKATLLLEVSPEKIGKGFIREGKITANSVDGGDLNFKFSTIKDITEQDDSEDNDKTVDEEETKNEIENEIQSQNTINENMQEQETEEEAPEKSVQYIDITSRSSEPREESQEEDEQESEEQTDEAQEEELVDEEKIIQEMLNTEEKEETWGKHQVQLLSDNEIEVKNVVDKIRIEVEIEYLSKEEITPANLYQKVGIDFEAKYIDVNLKETEESVHNEISIGWCYHKDIEMASEYTKFSAYQVGERQGSILENKVTLKRETEDENYLPLKSTSLEITVPMLEGEKPSSVSIVANKLMASKGQDTGAVEFTENDWNYNQDDGKITIHTNNDKDGLAVNTLGTDEYVIVYKYDRFVEEGNYTFDKKVMVMAEEYSSNENGSLEQTLEDSQEIQAVIGDMISYNISTSGDAVGKGKINANYNQETALYETEFTTTVNLNILTNDVFEEITVDTTKENYLDAAQTAFETNDIYYKKIKFNDNEIRNILEHGGSIEIYNSNRELLDMLNAETIEAHKNCEINLESHPNGVLVVLKNVSIDQNLSIEYTKAIGKSNYDKASFNTFREIESKVTATVKYPEDENVYHLSEISVRKAMESSKTVASLVLNNNILNTLSKNENVQMKVELNNDTEDSDLYVNPSFELVFPEYVKEVQIQDINLAIAEGLSVANYQTYLENGIVKMKIDLSGVQTKFSESTLTHGTNLLITADITVDEYAPSRKDQIKMYYYNEGVTNYDAQTKWMVTQNIPEGILRETNGFEVAMIQYAAPSGFVTANAIFNYDGQGANVKSIRQGEKLRKLVTGGEAHIATMELYVANNTGNDGTDVYFMGRVPFQDNYDAITGKALETTVNTQMVSGVMADEKNANVATIYYSVNENATADLEDSNNAWTTEPDNIRDVKTYLIVVDGNVAAGNALRYQYDFEIPANLEENAAIYGSFGAVYNGGETSVADKVGLKTDIRIPIRMKVTSDLEEQVGENRFVNYTVNVKNDGRIPLKNLTFTNAIPEGTTLYEKSTDSYAGNQGYVQRDLTELKWNVAELKSGETWQETYRLKVEPNMAGKTISNSFFAQMDDLTQKSNVHELIVTANPLDIEMSQSVEEVSVGEEVIYRVNVTNTTNRTEKNVKLKYTNPEELQVNSIAQINDENSEFTASEGNTENVYIFDALEPGVTKTVYIKQTAKKENTEGVGSKVTVELEDGTVGTSSEVSLKINAVRLRIWQTADVENAEVQAGEEIDITLNIENIGQIDAEEIKVTSMLSEYLEPELLEKVGGGGSSMFGYDAQEVNTNIYLDAGETYTVTITATAKENCVGKKIKSKWKISQEDMPDMETDEMKIKIVKPKKEEEEKEESKDGYSISGTTWIDTNQNGIKDEEDSYGGYAQMQLLKDGKVVQETTTDQDGSYVFTELEEGNYMVVSNYDKDTYATTSYDTKTVEGQVKSNAYETTEGVAVTESIGVSKQDVENVNIGLIEKEKFDFAITQSIAKATVNVNGKEKEYDYDDLDLAKLAIKPKDLENAIVKIQYKIRVSNVGTVAGKVSSIVDYLPNGMMFNEEENPFWVRGTDGNLYYSGLKDTTIAAKDFQDVTLILQKKMSSDNTGIVSNKAQIANTESNTRLVEAKKNNLASQETIVTAKKGEGLVITITGISIFSLIAGFGYLVKTGYWKDKVWIKKVYR